MLVGVRIRSIIFGAANILILAVTCLPPAFAEPEIFVQESEYSVTGQSAALIRQSLDRNTPVRAGGKPFDAYTKWDIDWQLRWTFDADGTCRMIEVTTTVRIRQTFPRLENADDLPTQLSNRWEGYMRALIEHEKGHAALGVDAAREIERHLSQMGQRSSCGRLESDANAMAREIIARFALREAQYDAATNYGERDGARFP
jgi:predicted secreted Zn-dependent protease